MHTLETAPVEQSGPRPVERDVIALPSPESLAIDIPVSGLERQISRDRRAIADILGGRDKRLLAIVGPCSVHSPDEALLYAERLMRFSETVSDAILVVMRVYIEKPRTTVGWRGLAFDPSLDGSDGPDVGLSVSRRLMRQVVQLGLPIATESLDPFVLPYVSDLLAFTSIGARTSASQTHRQMAASLDCPVGVKNGVCGSVEIAADAAVSIRDPQWVMSLSQGGTPQCVRTAGNADTALILRGGESGPNFSLEHQLGACAALRSRKIQEAVIVDCSHGNSGKRATRQLDVIAALADQIADGSRPPTGIMLESQLNFGSQPLGHTSDLEFGTSITDECLGFDETANALGDLAKVLRRLRAASPDAVSAC